VPENVVKNKGCFNQEHLWYSVEDKAPPKDGSDFLSACKYCDRWVYTQTKFGTFHPNAPGKPCYRDAVGHKVKFSHWMKKPEPPLMKGGERGE